MVQQTGVVLVLALLCAACPGERPRQAIEQRAVKSYCVLGTLSQGARVVPEIRDGKATGFRLYHAEPRLGLQEGDLLLAIDGVPVDEGIGSCLDGRVLRIRRLDKEVEVKYRPSAGAPN